MSKLVETASASGAPVSVSNTGAALGWAVTAPSASGGGWSHQRTQKSQAGPDVGDGPGARRPLGGVQA